MQDIMITGSNRGIGLALVKEYLSRADTCIFASCRNPDSAEELQVLRAQNPDTLYIVPMDINNTDSINAALEMVSEKTAKLDLLINNAGINPKIPENLNFGQLNRESVNHVVTTNSVSPVIVTQAFVDLLRASENPRVVMISSQMGSITRAGNSAFAYRVSKAAMNMSAKVLSLALEPEGITVITTHPGWVKTDMGGETAPVQPVDSAGGLVKIADNLTPAQSGKFFNYTGEEIPW